MSNNKLSVDQLSTLLQFYMDWPDHVDQGQEKEANEFYFWLSETLGEKELAELTGGLDGVKEFIRIYTDTLSRARYLKSRNGINAARSDLREEARIPVNTQVFFLVYDCTADPSLEGSILHGYVIDIGRQGVRAETNIAIPAGAIISMNVAQIGSGVTLYKLTGQVRWSAAHASSHHLGISIFNIEEYEKWQSFYYALSMND